MIGLEVTNIMANENKKDFNAMLMDSKDMPKVQIITDEKSIEKYGGDKMYFAPPIDYDKVISYCTYSKQFTTRNKSHYFIIVNRWCRFYRAYHSRNFCFNSCMGELSACRG